MLNGFKFPLWVVGLLLLPGFARVVLAGQPSLEEIGRKQFIRCASCHAMSADAQPRGAIADVGPHLEGIVGRPLAAVAGFPYSDALREGDFVWDEEMLDRWLTRPQDLVPGMCMPFMGLSRADLREALIAYLKNPQP